MLYDLRWFFHFIFNDYQFCFGHIIRCTCNESWSIRLFATKTLRVFLTFVTFVTFGSLTTVGHISREISQHVEFFINTEDRNINGHINCLKYRPLPNIIGIWKSHYSYMQPKGSSNIIEGIKVVLLFFTKRFHTHKKHKKYKTQINNFHSDVFYTYKKHK